MERPQTVRLGDPMAMKSDFRLISLAQRKGSLHQILNLRGDDIVIGRQEGCKVRIPSSAVSRKHCRLEMINELLAVEDLGSANGTYINDVRIEEQSYLKPGDVLRCGPFRFLVVYQLSESAIKHLLEYLTGGTPEGYDVDVMDSAVLALDDVDIPVALSSADGLPVLKAKPAIPIAKPAGRPQPPSFGSR
jgi:hypothetical protein